MNSLSCKYAAVEANTMNQSELEVRALVKTASNLNAIKENWEENKSKLENALDKNRRLWTIFAAEMGSSDSKQPVEIRSNILNLANFVFKRTMDVLVNPKPESLSILIDINMNIARGLTEIKNNCANIEENKEEKTEKTEDVSKNKLSEAIKDEYEDIFGE